MRGRAWKTLSSICYQMCQKGNLDVREREEEEDEWICDEFL